ncbi:MAG: hypothetical protein IJW18_05350 [Lachnospiraceae bacterium]|nr:hypothetical protein [Lachnospiraceae bacterium]
MMDMKKFYPPGYEYKKEWSAVGTIFALGEMLAFWLFAENLHSAREALFTWVVGKKEIMEGAVAEPFITLVPGYMMFFIPVAIFLIVMVVYHYFYYYQYTKSIYVMRRLSTHSVMIKSCVAGPVICMIVGLIAAVSIYFLYFGLYMLIMPNECMPRFM